MLNTQKKYDSIIAEVKLQLDRETTATLLSFIGYEIRRDFKFRLREDEKTPSCSISHKGLIKDFGSDFTGDVLDVLQQYHGLSFKDSLFYVADALGVKHE